VIYNDDTCVLTAIETKLLFIISKWTSTNVQYALPYASALDARNAIKTL